MNEYEIATDSNDKYHARNVETLVALCGETDTGYKVLNVRNTSAVAAWVLLDGRDASCKTCETAAYNEYLTTLKGA